MRARVKVIFPSLNIFRIFRHSHVIFFIRFNLNCSALRYGVDVLKY